MARIHPIEVCSSNTTFVFVCLFDLILYVHSTTFQLCRTGTTFVNTVFKNLTNPESESLQSLSIQTLGFIGSSIEGNMALEKLGIV